MPTQLFIEPGIRRAAPQAMKALIDETIVAVCRIADDLRVAGSHVVLVVEDNGIGLPADALRREGSGGLRGLRERVTLFGGTLTLDNAPGSGARLTVRLPLDASEASA